MAPTARSRRAQLKSLLACLLVLPVGSAASGCFSKIFSGPDGAIARPIDSGITKSELVARLNSNTTKIYSWRSTDVQIHARGEMGLPMKLNSQMAVEAPRNFRMRASLLGSDEADFGSNHERFWFWIRRSTPKHVFTSRHEDVDRAMQRLPLPFQPDWLIEVLGVIPIDEANYTMHPPTPEGIISLVSERLGPNGQPIKKVIMVDSHKGVIIGHNLYDATGNLIARATLRKHRQEPSTGVILPREIDLEWPHAGLAMTLEIGEVEVNVENVPVQTWQTPIIHDYPPIDLGQ